MMDDTRPQPGDATACEIERLQGTWQQTYCEAGGVVAPEEDYGSHPYCRFEGNRFVVTRADGRVVIEGTFTLDPASSPKTIDWTDTAGADAGKTFPAIYALEGDRLIFCAADEDQPRPTRLERSGKGQVIRVHERVIAKEVA